MNHSLFHKTLSRLYLRCFALIGLCLVSSWTASGDEGETKVDIATREKILLLGNGFEPKSLDPLRSSSAASGNVLRALYEGLVTNHPKDDTKHAPGVAKHWVANDDFTEWRFYLRKNARWSNGDRVTAHDFVYSYERVLDPKLVTPWASSLHVLKNGKQFNQGEIDDFSKVGVKAVGDFKLVCRLERPTPFFLHMVKNPTWLPVHRSSLEEFGAITSTNADTKRPEYHVGNGAFRLTEWKKDTFIKVRKNPRYWDDIAVKLKGIDFHPILDPTAEEKAFRESRLHRTYRFPRNLIAKYTARKDPALRLDPYAATYFYRCNTQEKPTDNVDFRRALSYATNRETIVKKMAEGHRPAHGFTPPAIEGYRPPKMVRYDPDKARKHLKKAGYQSGGDVPEFTIYYNKLASHKAIALAIKGMWKKDLGLEKVRIVELDWIPFQQSILDMNYEVSRGGWIADYFDPATFLDMWRSGDDNNNTGWSNKTYDQILRESAFLGDPKSRFAKFAEAESILLDQLPILPIYWFNSNYLLHPDVKNWNPLLLNNQPYKHLDLQRTGLPR